MEKGTSVDAHNVYVDWTKYQPRSTGVDCMLKVKPSCVQTTRSDAGTCYTSIHTHTQIHYRSTGRTVPADSPPYTRSLADSREEAQTLHRILQPHTQMMFCPPRRALGGTDNVGAFALSVSHTLMRMRRLRTDKRKKRVLIKLPSASPPTAAT